MPEISCVELLEWALPRLSLAWPGFRRVRRQVCRRIGKRVGDLKLPDLSAYRRYLQAHPDEWAVLDSFCRIPISRFFRDPPVFERLGRAVLPALAAAASSRGALRLLCWSAGCASGEEPYSVRLLWSLEPAIRFPGLELDIVATDIDETLLERARAARYAESSLRGLPSGWLEKSFVRCDGLFELQPAFRGRIDFRREDVRRGMPRGPFDLILCRNLVFTYFDDALRHRVLEGFARELLAGGALVIGLRERLPEDAAGFEDWEPSLGIYRRRSP